ncbi:MAG: response regulator [Bacilli bacterium]|nr:response regulator [Bacilli bacterium]
MKKIKKYLLIIFVGIITVVGIILVSYGYFSYASQVVFEESSAHLSEIYHQANISLQTLVSSNWNSLHSYSEFVSIGEDDKIDSYIDLVQKDAKFSDFYFISENGNYYSREGVKGYINLKDGLDKLMVNKEDIVVSSVVPGKDEYLVFAVPCDTSIYRGFEYQAIAISFNNKDLVSALDVKIFDNSSSSYIIEGDGRVLLENQGNNDIKIYNLFGALETRSNLTATQLNELIEAFENKKDGVISLTIDGISYYLIHQYAKYSDWTVVGLVPTNVVNYSMEKLQQITTVVVFVVAAIAFAAVISFFVNKYRKDIKNRDTELASRDVLFDTLSTKVDDVFIMFDSKTLKADYVSPNIEKLLGISKDFIKEDVSFISTIKKDQSIPSIFVELGDLAVDEQRAYSREYIHQKTKEIRFFFITAICKEVDKKRKIVLVMSDRTEEKKINQSLELAVRSAQSANRAKSVFLSNMSHDIRTPMNAIIGYSTLCLAHVEEKEKVSDYLEKILSSCNHLLSLINDILDMSRIESGKIKLEETPCNLSELLHDIRTIILGQINAKNQDLFMDTIDIENEDVYCDRTRINQVLINLLSNAVKFTPVNGTISVKIKQDGKPYKGMASYTISVKDNGIGMSEEFARRVFEPFERERTTTVSKIQGTGLGMSITKNIIDMMGGTIVCNTKEGQGTEFIINIKLKLQDVKAQNNMIKELEGLNALVVDDNYETCNSVTKMLTKIGLRSDWTLSGKEAILKTKQALENNDFFSAFIIDWRLPDINGIEVVRQVRKIAGDDVPIIILTAYDWTEIADEAKEAGVTSFCSKPMFFSDLKNSLLESINKKKEVAKGEKKEEIRFNGKNLLLVEDNELNREIAYELLKAYGFNIDMAENGQVAVDKVQNSKNSYDAILMDIQMPIMNGYEATAKIRGLNDKKINSIPIVAMTANAFEEDKEKAFKEGMDGFVSKPINVEDLLHELNRIIYKKGKHK